MLLCNTAEQIESYNKPWRGEYLEYFILLTNFNIVFG